MPSAITVGQLLNSAQDSAAAADRCAGSLWKLAVADPDGTYEELRRCVDHLVTLGQKSTYVERCVRFFGAFAAKMPADNEAAAAVVEELLSHLSRHLSALEKAVRYRSAQLLQQLLSGVPASLLLENSVAELLRDSLQERLHDKQPAVRAEACRALSHLVSEDEDGQAILAAMLQLLDTDKSKDVRIAVLQSLPLDAASLPVLLERARDVNPLVRKALVVRLKGLPIKLLSIKQRAEVIQQLLQDRDAAVADAGAKLLSHWLENDCGGDPLQLLQLLDVETYTDAAALAVESLINSGSIGGGSGVTDYVDAASRSSLAAQQAGALLGLRALAEQQEGQQEQLLMPHEALMWRCLCEWLRSDAISKGLAAAATGGARAAVQAAVAAERHEVLERALPESAGQLMGLVMRHAAAGPAARFAAAQLMIIASSCVEWVDAASRSMAAPYLQQLIGLDPQSEAEQEDELMSDDDDDAADAAAAAGLQLAGNGGEGLFEAAVTQLVLAVQGAGAGFTVAMLDGVAPLAAAAGLLAKPGGEAGAAAAAAVTVCVAEPSQVLQCLAYIKLLLQQLPSGRPVPDEGAAISFDSLWETLLLLALKQEQPEIRGLLELLLEQAEVLLAEARATAAKPKRGGRPTSASKAEPAPLPAATAELLAAALHVVCKKNPAALLVKYVLQLLQATDGGDAEQQQQPTGVVPTLLGDSYDSLALQLLGEVEAGAPLLAAKVQPAKFKPYLSAVLKVVCELPLHPAQPHFECMQRLADRLALAVSDATLKKEVASVQLLLGRLLQEAGSSEQQQQLPAEALDRMIEQMQEMCLRELKPMPGSAAAAGDEAAATPAAPRTTRKAAAGGSSRSGAASAAAAPRTAQRRPAGRLKAAAISSSDDEDEESSESSATESDDDSGDEGNEDSSRARAEEAAAQKIAAAAPAAVGKGDVAAAAAALGKAGSRRSSATARQPLAPTTVDNSQQ
ncbi:hypothetical protein OEZ85_001312 [Tetradesmus obliquus]|uniref:Nuclear condensin complex subunit 3 C-terminal domain-containing protein n=1 Tax=Tetradesmus obliquus TaxID=3088 RepID=A0ABY8UQJ7_TETOB|nr:hypothetical protein OEZ85_001312 [Tetradesmus obliquus]